jgi:hypothetical protein
MIKIQFILSGDNDHMNVEKLSLDKFCSGHRKAKYDTSLMIKA